MILAWRIIETHMKMQQDYLELMMKDIITTTQMKIMLNMTLMIIDFMSIIPGV